MAGFLLSFVYKLHATMNGGAMSELKIQSLGSDEVQEVLNSIEAFLVNLRTEWDEENAANEKAGWFATSRVRLVAGTVFIIRSLDRMIQFVEDLIPVGEDKKAAVMMVVGNLYDYIVVEAFPIWMKPFSSSIRKIIVDIVVACVIDFIVGKYRAGAWQMDDVPVDELPAETKEDVNVETNQGTTE
jgi:hypothetical protein